MNTATTKAENAANQATETAEEIKADREKITTNEVKISELKSEKVDKPSADDDGKIPRAKEGGVEWVEVGQPTDAQTTEAVTKWLDKHPEATTTVQNGAISYEKLNENLKNSTDAVTSMNENKFNGKLSFGLRGFVGNVDSRYLHSEKIYVPSNSENIYYFYTGTSADINLNGVTLMPYDNSDTALLQSSVRINNVKQSYKIPEGTKYIQLQLNSATVNGSQKYLTYEDVKKVVTQLYIYVGFVDVGISTTKSYARIIDTVLENEINKEFGATTNALEIGCIPNDASFDNGAVINNWFNQNVNTRSCKRILYFGEGTYYFTTPIIVPNRFGIVGSRPMNFRMFNYTALADYARVGTLLFFKGTGTAMIFKKYTSLQNVCLFGDSYIINTKQEATLTSMDELFSVTTRRNNVSGVEFVDEFVIDGVFITGFSGFGMKTNKPHVVLKGIQFKNCYTALIMEQYDHMLHDLWFSCCYHAIEYAPSSTSTVSNYHQGLFNCWFDQIYSDAIITGCGLWLNTSGLWIDLCGGSFIKAVGDIKGLIQGRIHRCNIKDVISNNMECGNIHAGGYVNLNLFTECEDMFVMNPDTHTSDYKERYLVYSTNGYTWGFVTVCNRTNIAKDTSHMFAIKQGVKIA